MGAQVCEMARFAATRDMELQEIEVFQAMPPNDRNGSRLCENSLTPLR